MTAPVSEYPLTLDACRGRDQAKWAVGDALLKETDGSLRQAESVAAWLASQDEGFDYSASTIQGWRRISEAFSLEHRQPTILFSVYEAFMHREVRDPVASFKEYLDSLPAGERPKRRTARAFAGHAPRKPRKPADTDGQTTLTKDIISGNPDVLAALVSDPSSRDGIRRALRDRDTSVVAEAATEAEDTMAGSGAASPSRGTKPASRPAVTRDDVLGSLDFGADWVSVTARYVEKNEHLALMEEDRELWARSIDVKIQRMTALRDVILSGTSSTATDEDLESLLKGDRS